MPNGIWAKILVQKNESDTTNNIAFMRNEFRVVSKNRKYPKDKPNVDVKQDSKKSPAIGRTKVHHLQFSLTHKDSNLNRQNQNL